MYEATNLIVNETNAPMRVNNDTIASLTEELRGTLMKVNEDLAILIRNVSIEKEPVDKGPVPSPNCLMDECKLSLDMAYRIGNQVSMLRDYIFGRGEN